MCPGGAGGLQCALTRSARCAPGGLGFRHSPPPGTKALSRVCGDRPGSVRLRMPLVRISGAICGRGHPSFQSILRADGRRRNLWPPWTLFLFLPSFPARGGAVGGGVTRTFLLRDRPEGLGVDGAAQCGICSVPGGSPCPTRSQCPGKGWKGPLSRPCRLGMKVVEEGAGREPGASPEGPFPSARGGGRGGAPAKANCADNGCYY